MELKIYRIDRSLSGKVGHFFKKPDLPVIAGAAFIGNPFKVFTDVTTENVLILHNDDEVKRFRNPLGEDLLDDVYYVRHPKKLRTDCLIPATKFHAYIVREQIADLVSYIRANSTVRKLHISIKTTAGANIKANGILDGIPLEGTASLSVTKENEVIIECKKPLRPSEKKSEFVWLEDFKLTVTAVDSFTDGTIEINENCKLSFGVSAKVAEQVGISGDWLNSYHYHIKCDLA